MSNRSKQNTISEYTKIVCPNCNVNLDNGNKNSSSSNIITDHESGEYICGNCGLVLSAEKAQETRPEWRTFNSEQSNINWNAYLSSQT